MPIYKYNGQTYDIPDNVVSDFEKKRPDATIAYQVDGNIYDIPLAKREGFLSKYPSASLYQEKVEQAKEIDPFQPESVAKPLYTDFSYQESVANQENSQYYPSPLNEEGRVETEPMSYEDRSRQEYEMLMRQLEEFDAVNGNMMDTYEAYEKAARHQINEGGFALDTMEREYLDANSGEYRARKQERDALNERIKNNSYFNQMRMAEADAANEAVDAISDLMAQNEAENTELHKKMKAMNALAMNPRGSFSGFSKTKEMQEYVDERDDLLTAKRLYENTAQVYAAPINDGEDVLKKFGQGFVQRGDDLDFWTMGIVGIADDMNARAAFQKIQDKLGSVKELANLTDAEIDALLTPSEQLLISAVMDNNAALYARKDNTAGAYEAGAGTADSLMFMAQFLLTGGVGDAATVGTAAHRRLVNWLGRKVGSMSNGLMKDVARGAVKLGVGTAESIGKALVMTPLMPHTYANIADNIMSFDDKGELMDVTDAILTGAADALIETWSESTGDFVNKVLGVPGDITKGIAKKALKNVDFSDWGRMANAPIMKILRKGGFNGFLGEMGEEFIGNAVRSISGLEPDAFKEFTKLENLLVTAGSFAPMTIFGLGVSGAQYGWQKRKLDNAQKAFEAMLREASYTEDQARFVIDELLGSTDAHLTPEKLVANFSPLLRELAFNDKFANNRTQALNSAIDLMWQIARYRTFDGVYHRQEEQQRNDMLAEIQEGTGREFWTTRLSDKAGLDGTAYETDEVRAVEFNDGRVAYVLGGDGVNNTVVYNDGQTGFLSEEQLNEGKANGSIVSDATMGLNDYLTQQVARVRMTEEEQRMFAERNTNIGQVRAQFPIDATVELGTTGAPIQGVVRQQTPNGVIVESPAGISQLTWEELGHTIGIEVNPQTDAQMEEEAINNLEIADLQRRRAREQRRAQRNAAAEAVLEEEQMVDEAENEGLEKPIPMKADGTVDQTAFWNESPARWAQWKTEQRQDGGAYASTYIQNAIGILEGQIAESEAAFLAESDFDAKDALEQTINQQRARLAELQDLAMQYMPAVIPAETSAEASAEQTQPGAETSQPAVMADRQKFELDAEYQRRLSLAKTLAEKEMILKEYFAAISAGSMEAVVMNKKNYKQVMKENGCSEDDILEVENTIKRAEENNESVDALHANDKIFVIAEYNTSVEQGRISYVHERQHNITKHNPSLIQRVLALGLSREQLQKIVRTLAGTDYYDKKSDDVLADEILSSTMEIAYTFDDFSVTLSKLGLPIELINLLNEINNEQRNDYTLVNARRSQNANNNAQRSSRQNDGNQGEVSGGVLGQEGEGALDNSPRGNQGEGESGEPATGGAEASEEGLQVPVAEVDEESEEKPKGPDFRITGEEPEDIEDITEPDGTVRFSVRTYHDWTDNLGHHHKGTRAMVIEKMEEMKFSKRDIKKMVAKMDTAYEYMEKLRTLTDDQGRVRFEEFNEWAKATPLYKQVGRDYVKAITSLVSNGDYPINLELTTDCIKREAFTHLLNALVKRGAQLSGMGPAQIITMQKVMKQYGIEVACQLCFVEGKRLQIVNWASQIVEDWNDALEQAGVETDEYFEFGKDGDAFIPSEEWRTYEDKPKLLRALKAIDDAALLFQGIDPETFNAQRKANQEAVAQYIKEKSEAWAKKNNKPASEWKPNDVQKAEIKKLTHQGLAPSYVNENLLEYRDAFNRMRNEWLEKHPNADPLSFSPTKKQWEALDKIRNRQIDNVKAKMVRLIMEHPEMRKKMTINDLLGSKGLMEIRQQHGQPYADLYSIILQRFGTGTPKPVQDAVPYDGEVLTLTESAFKKANEIGGARLFSFSDFDITKVFDYMQMFFDLEAKRQKLQSYTKEVAAVLIFGRSNAKFNISTLANAFVPIEVQEEYKKASEKKQKELRHTWAENAGLIVDENGTITGINFSEEHSVSPEFAQSIFRDDTRNKDCGAIMVGASVNHAIYSAAVNWIRMVIPFHLSGMPLAAREKTDVLWYTDNTEYQSTRKKTKDGWSKIEASKDTFNLYEGMDQPGWDMRQRAKDYLAWCAENGYRPKFDWGINSDYYRAYCEEAGYTPNQQIIDIMDADTTDGVWNQYYKFLTDFTAYKPVFNEQGEMIDEISSPQLAVESNFDFSEMEKEVLFEGENSMLGHREENIKRTENYIEEIADRVVPFLNGEISEEEMNLREDVHYENRADAELYLNAQKKSERPIDLVEEARKAQANDLMFRFIGEKAAQRLDAMVNATTMMDNLQIARDMEAQLNPDWSARRNPAAMKIKMATGWERGVDGMWRKEMEDFEYRPMPKRVKKTYKLSGLIKDSSLFVEYPELKDIEVKFKKLPRNTNGQLIPVGNSFRIELSEDLYQKMNPDYIAAVDNFTNEDPDRMSRILNHTASPEEISDFLNAVGSIPPRLNEFGGRDTLAHEIQHAIQHIEGFAIGGNVNMVDARDSQVAPFFARLGQEMEEAQKLLDEYDDLQGQLVAARIVRDNVQIRYLTSSLTMVATQYKVHYQNIQTIQKLLRNFAPLGESGYHRLSGEVEARNVAERLDMSPEERRESIIADTQDVAHEDQIILRNYLMTDYATDTLVPGHVKGQPMLSDVEMLSDVSFRISNNTRRTIEGWCDKAGLAEDIKEGFIDHLEYTFDDTTEQLCAAKWYLNGTINLPNEDEYKVVGAVKVAKQNKVDPLLYYSPMDIFEKFGAPKEKLNPINPDKVSTLKNKTEVPGTDITIYDVEDSEESRKNMREIINTHYGKNASPWCLLQGDAYGNLSENSAEYWEMYSAYPKQVAFKNGRLLAFSANSSRVRTWWDRMDKSYGGVPVAEKLNDAKNRRCSVEIDPKTGKEIKRSNIYSLVEKDGYTIRRNWNEVDGPMISAQKLKDDQVVAQFNRFTRDDFANDIQYFFYGRPKGIDMVFTLEKSMMFYENGELESYSVEGFRAAYARNSRKAWTITTRESTIREFSFNRQGRLIEYFDGQRLIKDRKTLAQVEVPSEYIDIVRRDPKSFMAEAEQLLVETGLAEAYEESQEDIRFRVLDTTNAELKEKPIKLNGMYRFNLKNAFKGVKDNGGSYPYIKVQLEEVSDDYSGEKIAYNGILEGFTVIRIPKGLITEGEKDNVFFIDPKAIENELWDVLRATENYYEFKHGGAPYQRDWLNADNVRFRITPEQDKAYMDAVKAGDMETAQRMVDAAAAAAGYAIRGDHGRVSKFTIFDRDKANPEGNWGQGFYFTNNEEDVENNYATVEGPDLEAKIEREVEKRVGIAEMNEEFNEDGEVDEFAIREEVEKEFITSEPNIVHAAIKMDKPFVVGHGMVVSDEAGNTSYDMQETYLDVEYEYDEDGEIDYDSEPTGTLIDLIDALNEEISNYDWANFNANEILQDAYDGMTASQFESAARELLNSHIDELVNERGDVMTSEILRAAIERAGFDGIIDNTVNQKFGTQRRYGQSMAGMDSDTRHYISFDSSNIKDADPVTYDDAGNVIPLSERFNPENEDIRFRMRGENETAEEFVNGIIDDFKAKYNAFNEIIALDPTSKTQVAKFIGVSEEDISDEDMVSFLKELEGRDSRGWYNNKRIAIFVRKNVTDGKKSELVLIHENIHAINKEHPDLIAIGEYLWNTAQKGTREYKYKMAIAKAYPESEWFDEMSAYVVSEYMQDEQIDKLKSLLDSDNIESLNKLLNISGYGKDRSKQRPRVTWNVLRKRPSETTEESGRTEEGGEPGDLRFRTTEITPEVREEMDAIHASAILMGNFMKAPNGKGTNLTEEQWLMVRTKNFKSWFGDWENDPENASKVVDENGEPMVVYHGSPTRGITVFKQNYSPGWGKGSYFTDNKEQAEDEFGENVYGVFLNLKKPYTDKTRLTEKQIANSEAAKKLGEGYDYYEVFSEDGDFANKVIRELGFDGIAYMESNNIEGVEYVAFNPSQIKSATDNTGEFSEGEGDIRFKVVTDPAKIEELEDGPKVEAYRAVQIDKNGRIYSPMASRLKSTKKGTKQATNEAAQMNQWDEAVESLDKVDENGRITILDEDGGTTEVAYNPYGHCCVNSMMNDQFKRAWERDGLYVMKALAPESELTAGYHAEKAKDAVGVHKWKTGAVGNKLPENKRREILLTRWMKNVQVMPWEAVAQDWIKTLEGENIDVPFNVVPRKILNMLAEAGVKIVAPEKGMENATKAYEQWLADPEGYVGNTELPDHVKALNEETNDEGPDNEPRFRVTGTPTEEVVAEGVSLSPAQLASLAGDIFAVLPEDVRKKITDGLNGNILGLQDAILQIPTSLATKEEWNDEDRQMAEVVAEQMTKAVGIEMTRPFSASEALWTLYNAVNKSTDLVSEASRALVRRNLGFDSQTLEMEKDARDGVRFRTVGNASANAQASMYNRGAANVWTRLKESFVDMHASVEKLVKAIEKRSGKVAEGFENILMALNQQSSKGLAAMEAYEQKFLNKMFDEIREIMDKTNFKYEDIVRYVILKHGLERNVKLAQRDARAHYQDIYDDIIAKIKGMNPAQKRTYLTNAQLRDADAKAELAVLQGVNTSALTPDQLRDHKKELAKAKKEADEAAEHLVRAQKIATMTEQDAQDELNKIFDDINNESDSVYKEMRKNDYSGISSMFYDTLGVDRKNYATEEEYQAALMQAKADKYANLGDIEGAAQMEVTLFENAVNTDNLWKSINKATKETLRQQYEANMISKDQYLNLRDMFEYYVPLRGFADNTAEDMYTYYRRPNSTGYTKPILGAEGRKTEAESPFGWIAAMAGSAIASNVKNEAKLALYYFVANRPDNGIATLSKTWFVHTPGDVDANGKKIFRPAYPPFSEDLSSASAKADYEIWQANMKNLQAQGLAYEAGQRLNLGNSVVNISDTNKPEHIVNVKVGGKDYTIVINGNPRAAQAINGDLNIESSAQDYSAVFGPMLRWMSSVNTSYNPEFWITNMMRDMAFTLMAVNIKGDPAYRRKFFKNYAKAFKVIGMAAKKEKGTLGNKYIENMYKDFVKYGGVTGYTQIKDSETWEKEIENYLASNDPASIRNGEVMRGLKSVFHAAHRFGESLEQVSRFAAFLTAMETGKSINEAINDAKEITVNFNRKGSGKMITLEEAKYLTDKNGQPLNKLEQWAAVGLSSIAPLGRRMIMFFNAAIQGLNATYKLYAKDKTRAIGWALGYAAVGMINAVLHAMLDDDDDYLDIPQYERRNSLMIGWNGAYIKWALPQEARAFYALGDLAVESVMGRNPHQNVIGEALKISTEILPVNPSEGWKAFMPSVAIPLVELALNEDYKGAPIYNEQKWLTEEERKRSTKWSKAYSGTGDLYIGIAKVLNAVTGGDEHDAGLINLQPEKMEHLVQSAFGGTIRTADKFINTIMAAFDPEEDVTVRQFPFLNRILTINDERYKNVHVNDVYDYYAAEAEHALTLKKQYEKDKDKDSYNKLLKSDEYKWATIYSKYKKPIKKYQEAIKAADTTKERMELMKQQDELKRKMIKEISDL